MAINIAAQIGAFLSGIAAFATIYVVYRTYKLQANAQIFMEYTRRYEQIMAAFPGGARSARLDLEGEPPESTADLSCAVLRYLNLCSEEFYLCKEGLLSPKVWRIWECELRRTLASPLVRREWRSLRREFRSYPEFHDYVDSAQSTCGASR
jgi:hypothetical protein